MDPQSKLKLIEELLDNLDGAESQKLAPQQEKLEDVAVDTKPDLAEGLPMDDDSNELSDDDLKLLMRRR